MDDAVKKHDRIAQLILERRDSLDSALIIIKMKEYTGMARNRTRGKGQFNVNNVKDRE